MLAIPMSALKRYKWVITAIIIVTFILGGLWHVLEAFRHLFTIDIIEWSIIGEDGYSLNKTFVYVFGSLLAIPLLWNGEKIVDCLGHSNIFILAFVSFTVRFCTLYCYHDSPYVTFLEVLEPISFYLAWLAVLLFLRHLIPKKFLALGQALLVILFFSLGRAFGFFFGVSLVWEPKFGIQRTSAIDELVDSDFKGIYTIAAAIALIAAAIYFIVYHLILCPRFKVPINRLTASTNDNPQRVFHDERSRKGYFRY